MEKESSEAFEKQLFWVMTCVFSVLSFAWCCVLGAGRPYGTSLALATCGASFLGGSLIGFVFTLFGDEVEPLGKIRDAVIAIASGIAGVSLAKVAQIRATLGTIPLAISPQNTNSWFAFLFVTLYFIAGFYFMYLMRKLVLNPALAKSSIELARIQGSVASLATELSTNLPPSFLLGRDYVGEVVDAGGATFDKLRQELYSDAVNEFLNVCESDVTQGRRISPENVTKAAILHYYRTYFEKDDDARERQQLKAVEWINRALLPDPLDPLLQIKLADVLGGLGRYHEAVAIFERLERDDDSPQYVQQWLGYFLLFVEGRECDAIKQSLEYHERFPSESSGLFNAACGYAQLYTIECRTRGQEQIVDSENRKSSLKYLAEAIAIDPELKTTAIEHTETGDSFETLAHDPEFIRITTVKLTTTSSA